MEKVSTLWQSAVEQADWKLMKDDIFLWEQGKFQLIFSQSVSPHKYIASQTISHFPLTNVFGSKCFPSCSGKIVSPKWKSFKGLRLLWRDKIRLNNAIWRAWFIQCKHMHGFIIPLSSCSSRNGIQYFAYVVVLCKFNVEKMYFCLRCLDVEKRKNQVCGFITPLDGSEVDLHRKPEVII